MKPCFFSVESVEWWGCLKLTYLKEKRKKLKRRIVQNMLDHFGVYGWSKEERLGTIPILYDWSNSHLVKRKNS